MECIKKVIQYISETTEERKPYYKNEVIENKTLVNNLVFKYLMAVCQVL